MRKINFNLDFRSITSFFHRRSGCFNVKKKLLLPCRLVSPSPPPHPHPRMLPLFLQNVLGRDQVFSVAVPAKRCLVSVAPGKCFPSLSLFRLIFLLSLPLFYSLSSSLSHSLFLRNSPFLCHVSRRDWVRPCVESERVRGWSSSGAPGASRRAPSLGDTSTTPNFFRCFIWGRNPRLLSAADLA